MSVVRDLPARLVGRALVRHDAVEKVAGRTRYAADFGLPGMLHAALKRSDLPHARLLRVDTSAAEAVPGVASILTAKDVPENTVWVDVPGQTFQVGALRARTDVLADGVVRYHGEPIAIVAAESEDAALAAVELIDVDYEELPVVTDPSAALEDGAASVHEEGNLLASWQLHEGDVDAALEGAHAVVEQSYETQFVDHAYLEPEAGVAWLDGDVITVRAATQVIEHYRDLARILRVPDNRVRVIAPYVGGGFGGKEDMTVEPFLALVVQRTGCPVKMVWSRAESLLAREKRHPMKLRYRTACDAEGRLVAQDIAIVADGGAYALLSALVLLYATTCSQGPYACPNVRVDARVAYTNHTPASAMRGFGAMQVALGYEGQMDLLAAEVGLDPLELRRRNFLERGDTLAVGQTLDTHVALPELADRVVAALGPKPEPSTPERRVGRGLACNLQPYGRCVWLNDWASAWVGFELDGTLVVRIGVPDIGGGQASSLVQLAGEVLGVDPADVAIHIGDSALTPLTGTTTATRQLYMSGNAVLQAAGELREELRPLAAELLETEPDDLQFADGGVRSGERHVPFRDLIDAAAKREVPWHRLSIFRAPGGAAWRSDASWRGRVFPDFTYGCHAVDLEVDPETGHVEVLRYVAAHDVGRAINPQSVEGQIEGAVVMGLGYALSERVVYEDAVNLTGTFAQYLIPTAVEAPEIEPIVVESGEGLGPFSARGIGEPPVGGVAPTVAGALADALGRRLTILPFTPKRVAEE